MCDRQPRLRGLRVNPAREWGAGGGRRASRAAGRAGRARQSTTPGDRSCNGAQHFCQAPGRQPCRRGITGSARTSPDTTSAGAPPPGPQAGAPPPPSRHQPNLGGLGRVTRRAPSLPGVTPEATFSKAHHPATIAETRPPQARRRRAERRPRARAPGLRLRPVRAETAKVTRPAPRLPPRARRQAGPRPRGRGHRGAGPLCRELADWPPRGRQGRGRPPIGPQPEGRGCRQPRAAAAGPGAERARGRRGSAEVRAGPGRACVPAPGAAEQGLISAGSWRPVRARAPRPNSMAIVRRRLCSGGGHFLRAGLGGQETLRAEAQTPRPPQPGVSGDGHLRGGALGLGPGPGGAQPGARRGVVGAGPRGGRAGPGRRGAGRPARSGPGGRGRGRGSRRDILRSRGAPPRSPAGGQAPAG